MQNLLEQLQIITTDALDCEESENNAQFDDKVADFKQFPSKDDCSKNAKVSKRFLKNSVKNAKCDTKF